MKTPYAMDDRIIDMVTHMRAAERDVIEEAALAVLQAIKSGGPMAFMPAEHLPLSGRLMMVHPKVYDRVRKLINEETEGQNDGE